MRSLFTEWLEEWSGDLLLGLKVEIPSILPAKSFSKPEF